MGYTNSTVQISNAGETDAADETLTFGAFGPYPQALATSFTTGPGQWLLGYVELQVKSWPDGIETLYVRILPTGSDGSLGGLFSGSILDFTHPRPGTGWVKFTAPKSYNETNPAVLSGNTTYWLGVFGYNFSNPPPAMTFGATEGDGEDTGGGTGWSIGDEGRRQTDGANWTSTDVKLNLRIRATSGYTPPAVNNPPTFTEVSPITRSFDEHPAAGANIGSPVAATDMDGDTLTYSLGGTDSLAFGLDSATGQIKAGASGNFDYERAGQTSFDVHVDVSDGKASASVPVTITMQDVLEPPSTPAAPTVVGAGPEAVQVTWMAPDNLGPDLDGFSLEYRETGAQTWMTVTATIGGALRSQRIENLQPDTEYEVRLNATNDEGTSAWSAVGVGRSRPKTAPEFDPAADYTRSLAENSGGGGGG